MPGIKEKPSQMITGPIDRKEKILDQGSTLPVEKIASADENPKTERENRLEEIFAKLEKEQAIIQETDQETKKDDNSFLNFIKNKMNQYSRIVFSRESTYRGFVDIFAEDIPSLAAAATRNWAYFKEDCFKLALSTSVMFLAPVFVKLSAKQHAKDYFNDDEIKDLDNLLLFNKEDLENLESFDEARYRVVNDEVKDCLNLIDTYGKDSKEGSKAIKKIESIKEFANRYEANEDLRKRLLAFKDKILVNTSTIESTFWGVRPFLERLFRKYVLGVNRFTGSLKYLNDKDADRLGNKKSFTFKQILGTAASIISPPVIIKKLMNMVKDSDLVKNSKVLQIVKDQMDTTHGIYPKLGIYAAFSNIPLQISKQFNSQDIFEQVENLIKFGVTGFSLFLGDRTTNGKFAVAEDKKLSEKYGEDTGILYKKHNSGSGLLAWINKQLPEAAKFNEVVAKTKHNPKLKKEAIDKYQKTFYKGFIWHAAGTFISKFTIYSLIKRWISKRASELPQQ